MGRKILLHGEVDLDLEDNARLAAVARTWFTQAAARLFPRLQQLADQGASEVTPVITVAPTMDDRAKSRQYSPERWQAILDELDGRPSVEGNAHYAGKREQERVALAGSVPATIVRATQFFHLAAMVVGVDAAQAGGDGAAAAGPAGCGRRHPRPGRGECTAEQGA